jgi:hypothetical protein
MLSCVRASFGDDDRSRHGIGEHEKTLRFIACERVYRRSRTRPRGASAKAGVMGRKNGTFVQGLVLKIFIEKYFVRKSHKIKREMCADRLASAISREIRWRVIKNQLTKQQYYNLYIM